MRFIKWGLLFIVAFAVAWVVIFTFNQEPFKIQVPAKILFWQTKSIPVYAYITGAFFLGLFFGLCIVLYEKIVSLRKLSKKNKDFRILEQDLATARTDLESCRLELSKGQKIESPQKDNNPGGVQGFNDSSN
jgi:hypothetical protein